MSAISRTCCPKDITPALPVIAGAAATCFANRIYEYPGAVLIGSAIAAITYLASSRCSLSNKTTKAPLNLGHLSRDQMIKSWESSYHSSGRATPMFSFDQEIQRMHREGSLSDELYRFIQEKMTEELRLPHSFYRFVDKWVEQKQYKLDPEMALILLRVYDQERNLDTEATHKMSAYLFNHPKDIQLVYSWYQIYRGVKDHRKAYKFALNEVYQRLGDEPRIQNLLAYQLARAHSKGYPINVKAPAVKPESEVLRKNTSVGKGEMIPKTDVRHQEDTIYFQDGNGILEEVQSLLKQKGGPLVVLNMFRTDHLEEVPLFLVSNVYESLESVSRQWEECCVIISPKVTFFQFKARDPHEELFNVNELFTVDVLSSPNIFNGEKGLKNKIRSMLRVAYHRGDRRLVIAGLKTYPGIQFKLYKEVLEEPEFKNRFEQVVFANER